MGTFVKTVLVIACMVMIIPLAIWGMTGSLGHAWFALKRYLFVMGILCSLGLAMAAVMVLSQMLN